ncbi:DUF4375 domain-containing protein [Blastopirellula marina]|uniref:DMP19 family protein n=1 Tax=Blastopirellula marina TaxID=124 RepID=UPI0011B033BA|nr:DUF4375 domain-containing protein [Blastopirellula marina]
MDHKTPFAVLLAEANDVDLVDGTFVKIGARYNHWVDASKYSPEERVIMLTWHSSGIIGNGGFEYLFSDDFDGDPDYALTAECFKTLGLMRSYNAFQDAFRLFPGGQVPHKAEKRYSQYVEAASEEVRESISKEVWKDAWEQVREKKLAQFIRENVSELGPFD